MGITWGRGPLAICSWLHTAPLIDYFGKSHCYGASRGVSGGVWMAGGSNTSNNSDIPPCTGAIQISTSHKSSLWLPTGLWLQKLEPNQWKKLKFIKTPKLCLINHWNPRTKLTFWVLFKTTENGQLDFCLFVCSSFRQIKDIKIVFSHQKVAINTCGQNLQFTGGLMPSAITTTTTKQKK